MPPLPHVKEATYVIEGFNEAVAALAAYHKKPTATGFLEPFKILCRTLTRLCNDKLFWRDLGRVAFSEDERVVDEALGNLDQLLDLERRTLLDAGVSIDPCELILQATVYLAEYRSLPIDTWRTSSRRGSRVQRMRSASARRKRSQPLNGRSSSRRRR